MVGTFIFSIVLGLVIGFVLFFLVRLVKSDLKDSAEKIDNVVQFYEKGDN